MADPFWSDVTLLLNFDGPDGATEFFDQSPRHVDVTAFGGLSTVSDAADFTATDQRLEVANSSALADFSGAMTVEALVTFDDVLRGPVNIIFGTYDDDLSPGGGFDLYESSADPNAYWEDGSGNWEDIDPGVDSLSDATEHHIAVTRSASGDWKIWVDGAQKGSTVSETYTASAGGPVAYIGGASDAANTMEGRLRALRVTKNERYTASFTAPTSFDADDYSVAVKSPTPMGAPEVVAEAPITAVIESPTPMGAPEIVASAQESVLIDSPTPMGAPAVLASYTDQVRIVAPSPLTGPSVLAFNDWSLLTLNIPSRYVMKVTGSPVLEIPISSWQATLQTDRENFLQCVVPASATYLDELSARQATEEFIIYRSADLNGVTLESEMARAGIDTLRSDRGPFRSTVTMQGFTTAFSGAIDRTVTLSDIRSISQTPGSSTRVRAAIDWYLRPGQTCTAEDLTFTVNFINYYVTSSGDAYMDVGSRG